MLFAAANDQGHRGRMRKAPASLVLSLCFEPLIGHEEFPLWHLARRHVRQSLTSDLPGVLVRIIPLL